MVATAIELANDPLQTILVATDFSETAYLTLDRALDIAKLHESEIVLLHVMQPELPVAATAEMVVVPPDYEKLLREASMEGLTQCADRVREAGLRVREVLEIGPAARKITACADAVQADLIMIGTRGNTGFKRLLLGSVAKEVVRIAKQPVLTVHPGDDRPIEPVRRLLFPTDFSATADFALSVASRLLVGSDQAKILLVHTFQIASTVVPIGGFGKGAIPHLVENAQQLAEKATAPAVQALRARGLEVEVIVDRGDPAEIVIELAAEHGVDVIVMGTRGHSKIRQFLLGSTAERVVEHAPCPVMTVHALAKDG
jgi:nucleotide-binding universal stress UspA family protein